MSSESFTAMIVRRLLVWMANSLVDGGMRLLARRRTRKSDPAPTTAEPPQHPARGTQRERD